MVKVVAKKANIVHS